MIQQTSILAYEELQDSKQLAECNARVYTAIVKFAPVSNRQIAELLKWSINRVTPRCQDLRKLGMVKQHGFTTDSLSGKKVMTWEAAE